MPFTKPLANLANQARLQEYLQCKEGADNSFSPANIQKRIACLTFFIIAYLDILSPKSVSVHVRMWLYVHHRPLGKHLLAEFDGEVYHFTCYCIHCIHLCKMLH